MSISAWKTGLLAASALAAMVSAAEAKSTLETVEERGYVTCGAGDSTMGFYTPGTTASGKGTNPQKLRHLLMGVVEATKSLGHQRYPTFV
ncbi:hypothetical protein J2857_005290 [Neorhizobium galegae]|uniref:hypothetical protein n=1 Tax=Neorhizobium galegae TaxID=399 RepID=UPI001AE8DF4D|nr:hypothetical protein [Neorhizobium galegae]MBP2562499.1 hypothetical protein [Neorhizobium galegae]